ncbi:uncharacterized protein K441DRAFT_669587 [Cenococcum geophilum 1.58]|uniref:Uncharacterized protein n=1 Tax=Cenococcum geophilum 1.58 TaxID=794803 RepID=A0ACC8EP93_9PEZI|nr:hypothetical protein K441DRAFT_669587 [Cenococcum geophilum 1.58]
MSTGSKSCNICNLSFCSLDALQQHLRSKHALDRRVLQNVPCQANEPQTISPTTHPIQFSLDEASSPPPQSPLEQALQRLRLQVNQDRCARIRRDDAPPKLPATDSSLRFTPVAFVKAGEAPKRKKKTKARRTCERGRGDSENTPVIGSGFRDHNWALGEGNSDGYNWALCDKDCGWCGHCADHVDY